MPSPPKEQYDLSIQEVGISTEEEEADSDTDSASVCWEDTVSDGDTSTF